MRIKWPWKKHEHDYLVFRGLHYLGVKQEQHVISVGLACSCGLENWVVVYVRGEGKI